MISSTDYCNLPKHLTPSLRCRYSKIQGKGVHFQGDKSIKTGLPHFSRGAWGGGGGGGGVYSKRKEYAPVGSKFFPFRVSPLSDGD